MIAEHSDRLYSADVLVSTKPMAGYCLSSPQPRRNRATRAMTRVRTRPGHQGKPFSPELSVVATPTPARTETQIHLHETAGVIQSP